MLCAVGLGAGCGAEPPAAGPELAQAAEAARARPAPVTLGVAAILIELTDNDIELQAFIDGSYTEMAIDDPRGRRIYETETESRLRRQGGLTDHFVASVPTHYLEDEPEFDGTIAEFLSRFPQGTYRFSGKDKNNARVTGEATLSHDFAALPEIVAPVSGTDTPPHVDRNDVVIDWEPVTTRFGDAGPIDVVEYQVVVEHETLRRPRPLADGTNRRMTINLPGSVTELRVPASFLLPNTDYAFEIIAAAANSNTSISVGNFTTGN
ncbi:MAG: hypothetical protein IT384_34250 [Deltaproteobacteria bacterium]|nr:hypothetical protein [Deltaproteobacteria bacterium]